MRAVIEPEDAPKDVPRIRPNVIMFALRIS